MNPSYHFSISRPHFRLKNMIFQYLSLSANTCTPSTLKIFGSNACSLIFLFGKSVTLHDYSLSVSHLLRSGYLFGPLYRYYAIEYPPKPDYFVIQLSPEFASLITNIPAKILKNQPFPLGDLFHNLATLEDELYPLSHSERVEVCNDYFLRIVQGMPSTKKWGKFQLVNYAKHRITHDRDLTVAMLSDEIGFSPKHVNNIFTSMVGYSPKQSIRFYRYVNTILRISQYKNLALAAADAGYFDQSHMYRDFSYFSNQTPLYTQKTSNYTLVNMLRESMGLPLLRIPAYFFINGDIHFINHRNASDDGDACSKDVIQNSPVNHTPSYCRPAFQ